MSSLLDAVRAMEGLDFLTWVNVASSTWAAYLWGAELRDAVADRRPVAAIIFAALVILSGWWAVVYGLLLVGALSSAVAGAVLFRPTVAAVQLLPALAMSMVRREQHERAAATVEHVEQLVP